MSSHLIIYPLEDNGVAVITPTPDYLQTHTIQECADKDVPAGLPYQIVLSTDLPSNYSGFRNAWVANFEDYQGVSVDLGKSKVIYKQTADSRAAALSTPLTQEYMRLMAIGGDTTAVQAQLKAINAAAEQTAYLNAATVNELIACWPSELGPNPFLPVSNEAE
jgi:hypothetical protein